MARATLRITIKGGRLTQSISITGVLGATGSVGQRFILLLQQHPSFVLHVVGASSRSVGKKYRDAVRWKQAWPIGEAVGDLVVRECKASEFADCDIVFSGLDSDVAGEIGTERTSLPPSVLAPLILVLN